MPPLTGDPAALFRVKLVADSVPRVSRTSRKFRLRSFQLTYPRILLAELNT